MRRVLFFTVSTHRPKCLDHVVVEDESHLRRVLSSCLLYYHRSRTHLGLNKDTPDRRQTYRFIFNHSHYGVTPSLHPA